LLAAVILTSSAALAQDTGGISGTVLDARTQAPLAEVTVVAKSPALSGEQTGVTDEKGKFEITLLPVGTYSLSILHKGFQPFNPEGLTIRPRRTVKVRLQLIPEETPETRLQAENPVEWNDKMTVPSMVSGPPVEYTQKAIDRAVQGTMKVKCVVNVDGVVHYCQIVQGLAFMDNAVISTLERRKYKPATLGGKPLNVWYTFHVRLKLPTN
jgi:TonB family protein